jgi:hypothetical protein
MSIGRLAGLLTKPKSRTKRGPCEEAQRLRGFGLNPDGSIAFV